jgi:hypothetical protein
MNPQPESQLVETLKTPHPVNQITPVSKYLALALFILLPFMGGYVGYRVGFSNVQGPSLEVVESQNTNASTTSDKLEQEQPKIEQAVLNRIDSARASVYQHDDVTLLHTLDKDSYYCEDRPDSLCKGDLYQIQNGYIKMLASNVLGVNVLYQMSNGDVLLSKESGDGSCRSSYFYIYHADIASTSQSATFFNNCDPSNIDYESSKKEFLSKYSL